MATELQIAQSTAEILDKLQCCSGNDDDRRQGGGECVASNWGQRNRTRRRLNPVVVMLGREEVDLARLEGMKAELALSRAEASGRDFKSVMIETELKVATELARILEGTVDPVLKGLTKVEVEAEEELVCGVCQEEMESGEEARAMPMGCTHKFHAYCIVKWLKHRKACPLCRFPFHQP